MRVKFRLAAIVVAVALPCVSAASPVLFGSAAIKKTIDDRKRKEEERQRAEEERTRNQNPTDGPPPPQPEQPMIFVKPPGNPPKDVPRLFFPETFTRNY
jgi:hypothetical protein